MEFALRVVQLTFATGALIGLALTVVLWRDRTNYHSPWLVLTVFSGTIFILLHLGTTVSSELVAVTSTRLLSPVMGAALVVFIVFVLEYTGRSRYVTTPVLVVLACYPLSLGIASLVNPGDVYYISLNPNAPIGVSEEFGIWFWLHTSIGYVGALITTAMIFEQLLQTRRTVYVGQAVSLAVGMVSVFMFNAYAVFMPAVFDTTPLGIMVLFLCLGIGFVKYDLGDITPIAHEAVIDAIRDSVLVIDDTDTIVDNNPAASRLLGDDRSLIGTTIEDLFAEQPELVEFYESMTATATADTERLSFGDRHFTIDVVPITDRRTQVGWLVIVQDDTEQVRRERDLERQIDRLDQFATVVSHDLRNPISIARGFSKQIKQTGDLSYLEKVLNAVDRMDEIVDEVLTLARTGQVTDPSRVELAPLLTEAWATVETKEATLSMTQATRSATIIADPAPTRRLFENLMRNSIEHGASEASATDLTVEIDVEHHELGTLTITVADDGSGIAPEVRDELFQEGSTTGGTGLGLGIVKQIAAAHGWTIEVGESDDGGAAFELHDVGVPISES